MRPTNLISVATDSLIRLRSPLALNNTGLSQVKPFYKISSSHAPSPSPHPGVQAGAAGPFKGA